jgi:hypothetical protein
VTDNKQPEEGDVRAWRHAMSNMGPLLDDADQRKIAGAVKVGITGEELTVLLDWAEQVRMDDAILENVLNGSFRVGVENGEPVFSLSPHGPGIGPTTGIADAG